jgi:ABC-type nitrate/sulfonate/bicarbonate transport system substrate-binding protein
MLKILSSCTLIVAAVLSGLAPAAADPVKLRIGWVVAGADAPFQLFGPKGVAVHENVTYAIEGIHFNGTPTMISAPATGGIDLAQRSPIRVSHSRCRTRGWMTSG